MAAPRLLPPNDELVRLVDAGYTHAKIAEHIRATTGIRVSRSTISSALSRAGLAATGNRFREELPWKVKAPHLTQYPARMLRILGRRRAGIELTDSETERLEAWLEALSEKGLVVAYAPDYKGFIYVDDNEIGDGANNIPIRKRVIQIEEIAE